MATRLCVPICHHPAQRPQTICSPLGKSKQSKAEFYTNNGLAKFLHSPCPRMDAPGQARYCSHKMKCLTCGKWSKVLETRERPDGSIRRLRACTSDHTWGTLEYPSHLHPHHSVRPTNANFGKTTPAAVLHWLHTYTWIQENGRVNFQRPRLRPVGLEIDIRELEQPSS